MTEIIYSALLGFLIGGGWATAELLLLFRVVRRSDAKAAKALAEGADVLAVGRLTTGPVLKFYVGKYFLNVGLLLVVFLLRGFLPWRWEFVLAFVGIGLTIFFQIMLMVSGLNKRLKGNIGEQLSGRS